jgi:uncharacterized membrane protein YqjE
MKLKNIYDPKVPTKNLVSTIAGVLSLVITGLVLFGVLTQEQAANLSQYVTMVITAVVGIIGMFFTIDPNQPKV